MANLLAIWLLPVWTLLAPVLWISIDAMSNRSSHRASGARPTSAGFDARPNPAYR